MRKWRVAFSWTYKGDRYRGEDVAYGDTPQIAIARVLDRQQDQYPLSREQYRIRRVSEIGRE